MKYLAAVMLRMRSDEKKENTSVAVVAKKETTEKDITWRCYPRSYRKAAWQ